MMHWRVRSGDQETEVETDDWLEALAIGPIGLGLELDNVAHLVCEVQSDGSVLAFDSATGIMVELIPVSPDGEPVAPPQSSYAAGVEPVPGFAAEDVPVARALAGAGAEVWHADTEPSGEHATPEAAPEAPRVTPPPIAEPAPVVEPIPPELVTIEPGRVLPLEEPPSDPDAERTLTDDAVEDLFLRLGDLSSAAGVAEASAIALRIVLEMVQAGAGAVLIRTRAGDGLRFRAASGPAARRIIDTVIPLDRGIAGYVCQFGIGLSIANVRGDSRHDARVDRSTGFKTRSILAVPVRAQGGATYGCLELLNPPEAFTAKDFEVAARVAGSLGELLYSVDAG